MVALHGGGAAELDVAFDALADGALGVVHHANRVLRQRAPHGDEAERVGLGGGSGFGAAEHLEGDAGHRIDAGRLRQGSESQGHGVFRQAVDGRHGLGPEAVAGIAPGKAGDGVRADGLGAVQGHAPTAEVEAGEGFVLHLAQAKLVGEVGGGGERAPVAMDGPQPALRAAQEGEGREGHDGQAEVDGEEPATDQPHVVVEGQPADGDVGGAHLDARADGAHVGEDVLMGQGHAAGLAGASRGVLDEGDVRGRHRDRRRKRLLPGRQVLGGGYRKERRHPRLQQARQALRLAEGNQGPGLGVPQDDRLAAGVFLNLVGAHGGIDGHRNGAGQQGAEEGEEEVAAGGQHQRHRVAAAHPPTRQPAGQAQRPAPQLSVGERLRVAVLLSQVKVGSLGGCLRPEAKHLGQGSGAFRGDGAGTAGRSLEARRDLARHRETITLSQRR